MSIVHLNRLIFVTFRLFTDRISLVESKKFLLAHNIQKLVSRANYIVRRSTHVVHRVENSYTQQVSQIIIIYVTRILNSLPSCR